MPHGLQSSPIGSWIDRPCTESIERRHVVCCVNSHLQLKLDISGLLRWPRAATLSLCVALPTVESHYCSDDVTWWVGAGVFRPQDLLVLCTRA